MSLGPGQSETNFSGDMNWFRDECVTVSRLLRCPKNFPRLPRQSRYSWPLDQDMRGCKGWSCCSCFAALTKGSEMGINRWKCRWEKQWMQAREKVLLTYAEPLIQLCRKLSSSGLLSSMTYLTSLGSVKKILVSKCFRIDDFQSPLKHHTFCNTCGKLFTWSL